MISFVWAIIVGLIAGVIAKFIAPSPNNPEGFLLTTVLGVIGGVVGTLIGRVLHLYGPGESAGIIGAIVGAVIILAVWHHFDRRRQY